MSRSDRHAAHCGVTRPMGLRDDLRRKACPMTVAGRMDWPKAAVVQGIAAGGAGEGAAAAVWSSDFAEVERAWIEALRKIGIVGKL